MLVRLERNDEALAIATAFDPNVVEGVDRRVEYRVERSGGGDEIVLCLPLPIEVRLDRLLARELGLSRAALAAISDRRELRRPVRDGQRIAIP
jgi:hypothetical protein